MPKANVGHGKKIDAEDAEKTRITMCSSLKVVLEVSCQR
jgi:hypothetical protein